MPPATLTSAGAWTGLRTDLRPYEDGLRPPRATALRLHPGDLTPLPDELRQLIDLAQSGFGAQLGAGKRLAHWPTVALLQKCCAAYATGHAAVVPDPAGVVRTIVTVEQTIDLASGLDFPHATFFLNGKYFVATPDTDPVSTTVTTLIRFDDPYGDLSAQTRLNILNDGTHPTAATASFCYSTTKQRFYVLHKNSTGNRIAISEVDPVAFATSTLVVNDTTTIGGTTPHTGAGSICTDETYLYVTTNIDSPAKVVQYRLSDFGRQAGIQLAFNRGHAIAYDAGLGKVFATGTPFSPTPAWIVRIDPATLTVEDSAVFPAGDIVATDDFAISGNRIFVGCESNNGDILVFDKTNLSTAPLRVPVGPPASCLGCFTVGADVWVLKGLQAVAPSRIAKIDPVSLNFVDQVLPDTGMNELAGDGAGHLWVTDFTQPGRINRLAVNP